MKKIISLFSIILIVFFIFSCSSAEKKAAEEMEYSGDINYEAVYDKTVEAGEGKISDSENAGVKEIITEQRKLIKTGTLEFETADLTKTRSIINDAVTKHKAYIANEQSYSNQNKINNVLVIRVDSKNFDKLVEDIGMGVEKFDTKTIDVSDITEEFLDIQARLKTKKELELRYLELLKKATKVSEVLEIEREITTLRSDIESIEGRLRYLSDRIDFSTLTVTYYKITEGPKTKFAQKFIDGFTNGVNALIWFLIGLVNMWPFILILAIILWLIRRNRIKRRKNKANVQ